MNYTNEIAKETKDPKILIDILRKENDDFISCYAVQNPNCPPEMLVEILRNRNTDTISKYAAMNPNCPYEIKIKWMKERGLIVKEDPSKHIIEYENNKKDDFQDLKDLL